MDKATMQSGRAFGADFGFADFGCRILVSLKALPVLRFRPRSLKLLPVAGLRRLHFFILVYALAKILIHNQLITSMSERKEIIRSPHFSRVF